MQPPMSALIHCRLRPSIPSTKALQRLYEAKVQNAEDFFPGVKGKKRLAKAGRGGEGEGAVHETGPG